MDGRRTVDPASAGPIPVVRPNTLIRRKKCSPDVLFRCKKCDRVIAAFIVAFCNECRIIVADHCGIVQRKYKWLITIEREFDSPCRSHFCPCSSDDRTAVSLPEDAGLTPDTGTILQFPGRSEVWFIVPASGAGDRRVNYSRMNSRASCFIGNSA